MSKISDLDSNMILSSSSNQAPTRFDSDVKSGLKFMTENGNQIELLDEIGIVENEDEVKEYHGNPEDMETFFNYKMNFKFPQEIESETKLLEEAQTVDLEADDESTYDKTQDEENISMFSERKKEYQNMVKKSKFIPDLFKKMKMPTDDCDIHFCDITGFPKIVYSEEEALRLYNRDGLCHGIQFKIISRRKDENESILSFTLAYAYHNHHDVHKLR